MLVSQHNNENVLCNLKNKRVPFAVEGWRVHCLNEGRERINHLSRCFSNNKFVIANVDVDDDSGDDIFWDALMFKFISPYEF